MTPQEFQRYLETTCLTTNERGKAWRLYKTSPDDARIFVEDVETRSALLRKNILLRDAAVPYTVWGREHIEQGAFMQMENAARLPIAVAGALMPDAHQGYGLPIGGVLATDNAVIPYAVGVDIACRMMLTVYPASSEVLNNSNSAEFKLLQNALVNNTVFGSGQQGIHDGTIEHPILDQAHWQGSSLMRSLRQTAIHQIGTSGTGNHFVEWGELKVTNKNNPMNLSIGNYLALLSHSGSRGVGYKIATHFTELAMRQLANLDESVKHLAWLSLESEAGQEYWHGMSLAGEFASANHHVIHERVAKAAGLTPVAAIENHHNFAWREQVSIDGVDKEVIVHRKGATPAGQGVLGIIPGTMADIGFVVMGKGNAESLNSASHGSGRQMSRKAAKQKITPEQHSAYLAQNNITLIGGGLDESPEAYKPIRAVIGAQSDLVDILGTFQPRIVRMAAEEDTFARKPVPTGIVDAEGD
ncbi:MAG: RtcB family protein [Verrucomicrobia bacterium]|nr:RtcB family protein [Verrucomicrobiota bacterium]